MYLCEPVFFDIIKGKHGTATVCFEKHLLFFKTKRWKANTYFSHLTTDEPPYFMSTYKKQTFPFVQTSLNTLYPLKYGYLGFVCRQRSNESLRLQNGYNYISIGESYRSAVHPLPKRPHKIGLYLYPCWRLSLFPMILSALAL